jgi:hypothetical protein
VTVLVADVAQGCFCGEHGLCCAMLGVQKKLGAIVG